MPTRAPVDELVRVEQDDSHHDRERDDCHGANVPGGVAGGLVSGTVLSHSPSDPTAAVNLAEAPRIEAGVTTAAGVLPFI